MGSSGPFALSAVPPLIMSSSVLTDYVATLATEIGKASSVALQPAAAQQPAITLNRDNYNANKALMPGSLAH